MEDKGDLRGSRVVAKSGVLVVKPHFRTHFVLKISTRAWRDGSVDESVNFSSRGPGFDSQLSHGSSWLPITPVPGYPMSPFGLYWHCR